MVFTFVDHNLSLKTIIQKCIQKNSKLRTAFMDLQKAYGVWSKSIWTDAIKAKLQHIPK